jgi:ribonuclease P protein component
MMTAPTFNKKERVVSKKLIESLFEKGDSHSLAAFPLRVVYLQRERPHDEMPVQILISVPKKRFKHAVDRNRVKRQIRESYRCNKQALCDIIPEDKQLLIAFIWLSDRHYTTDEVQKRVVTLLQKIANRS